MAGDVARLQTRQFEPSRASEESTVRPCRDRRRTAPFDLLAKHRRPLAPGEQAFLIERPFLMIKQPRLRIDMPVGTLLIPEDLGEGRLKNAGY